MAAECDAAETRRRQAAPAGSARERPRWAEIAARGWARPFAVSAQLSAAGLAFVRGDRARRRRRLPARLAGSVSSPWGFLLGFALGVVAGIRNVFKASADRSACVAALRRVSSASSPT